MKSTGLQHKLIAEIETHSWSSFDVSFSPDSRTMAAGTHEEKGFNFIDTKTWRLRHALPDVESCPAGISFSPDSQTAVIAFGKEAQFSCWDLATGRARWSFKPGSGHAAFSPDGKLIAATRGNDV